MSLVCGDFWATSVSVQKKSMKRLIIWGIAQEEEGHAGAWRAFAFQIPTYIIGLDSLCGSGGLLYFFLLLSWSRA